MNIAVICYPTPGGSGVIATELSKSLADRGHNVHIISSKEPLRASGARDRLTFHGISVPQYELFPDPSYGMSAGCAVAKVVRSEEIDIVHAHYAYPHALSANLARDLAEKPDTGIVTTLHGTDIFLAENHPCHFDIVRYSLKQSDRVTAVSAFLKEETSRILQESFNIRVIPNFVDTDRFSPTSADPIREELGLSSEGVLVHVSNFREIKNSEDVVHMLRHIHESGTPAHLIMVGNGPERERARRLASEFHMREHVTWMEPREEIEGILAASDLAVVTSEKESFCMAALESMSCGVPILNTAKGGIRELVRDGTDGYHEDPGDIRKLASRAAELLEDEGKRKEMGKRARDRAIASFSTETVVDQYESLYEELL